MKTVLYFDTLRNKKKIFWHIVIPVIVVAMIFLVFTIVERCVPVFNAAYMKWPDIVKDLLGMPGWSSHLAINVWQIFSLIYPFYLIYVLVSWFSASVIQEDRLETYVYLRNARVSPDSMFAGKLIFWVIVAFLSTMSLLIVNSILLLLIGAARNIVFVVFYYVGLFLICIFYLTIAGFLASYKHHENSCKDRISTLLILSWLVSRIPAILRMFSMVMEMTGREGEVADKLVLFGERFRPLEMVAPVIWCWQSVSVSGIYVIVAVLVGLIMGTSALFIYLKRHDA